MNLAILVASSKLKRKKNPHVSIAVPTFHVFQLVDVGVLVFAERELCAPLAGNLPFSSFVHIRFFFFDFFLFFLFSKLPMTLTFF